MINRISNWNPKIPLKFRQRQWADNALSRGHSPFQIATAFNAVMTANDLISYHRRLHSDSIWFTPSCDTLDSWRKWWKNPALLWNTLLDQIFSEYDSKIKPRVLLRYFRISCKQWDQCEPEKRHEFLNAYDQTELQELLNEGRRNGLQMLEETLQEACDSSNVSSDEKYSEEVVTALHFMLQVALPAYLEFGFSHAELYRQAVKQNDSQALARILKLDPSACVLPVIAQKINEQSRLNKTIEKALIREELAVNYHYLGIKHSVVCKAAITGWLIDCFQGTKKYPLLGRPFKIPQISRLFDARAVDHLGLLCDEDIQDSPDTFRKMVNRSRKRLGWAFWDIFSVIRVPVK